MNNRSKLLIFSLDISQERTGYSLVRGKKVLRWGCFERPPHIPEKVKFSSHQFTEWLSWFKDEVMDLLSEFKSDGLDIDAVAMEDLNSEWIRLARPLYQFQAAAKLACFESLRKPIFLIHNASVKSLFNIKTHRKNTKDPTKLPAKEDMDLAKVLGMKVVKIQMVKAVNRIFKLGLSYEENDEADSIGLGVVLILKIKQGEIVL